jgi:hypothetical protein
MSLEVSVPLEVLDGALVLVVAPLANCDRTSRVDGDLQKSMRGVAVPDELRLHKRNVFSDRAAGG